MIQKPCKHCRRYSEAVAHGRKCPWCCHDSNLNFDPFKVIIVLAFVGLLAALASAVLR